MTLELEHIGGKLHHVTNSWPITWITTWVYQRWSLEEVSFRLVHIAIDSSSVHSLYVSTKSIKYFYQVPSAHLHCIRPMLWLFLFWCQYKSGLIWMNVVYASGITSVAFSLKNKDENVEFMLLLSSTSSKRPMSQN